MPKHKTNRKQGKHKETRQQDASESPTNSRQTDPWVTQGEESKSYTVKYAKGKQRRLKKQINDVLGRFTEFITNQIMEVIKLSGNLHKTLVKS